MSSTPWSWKQWWKLVGYDVLFLILIGIVMTVTSQQSVFGKLVWLAGLALFSELIGLFLSIITRYFSLIDNRAVRVILWLSASLAFIGPLVIGVNWVWALKAGSDALALLLGGLAGFFWSQLDQALRAVRAGRVQSSRLA